jgi:hypothetical protein
MKQMWASIALGTFITLTPFAAFAQGDLNVFRLPPSVGATPIEIPGAGRRSATPIEIPGAGRQSATPIEIPGRTLDDLTAALPLPIPGASAATLDPRREPGRFSKAPLPVANPLSIERMGSFVYVVLPDRTIYGDTNFGYARFETIEAYQLFLRSH